MSNIRMLGGAQRVRGSGLFLSLTGALFLAGCSIFGGDSDNAPPPPPYTPVEFAMPAGTSINRGDTTVVGDSINWYGTLSLSSDSNMDDAHQFYSNELPREGWEPVATLVANRVVLQFINRRQGRAAIVTIEPRTIGGSHIEVIVAPLTANHSGNTEASPPRSRPDR